jgi:DNA-binding NtrC family response regulator
MSEMGVNESAGKSEMKKILVVENDDPTREFLDAFLTTEGFTVATAQDGEEGSNLYDEFGPDLVVTDLLMPRKNGVDLVAELRARNPGVRVIYISGCIDAKRLPENLEKDLAEHPDYQVLAKPFKLQAILQSIEQALAP